MDMTPQEVRSSGFRVVKKGYDPAEVDTFKERVAQVVEQSQSQATAMEARARAAVAKLQEVSQQMAANEVSVPVAAPTGDHDAIGRALLLAQRTADAFIAESRTEAEQIVVTAREEAGRVLDSARTMAAKAVDDARADARRAGEDEKIRAESEVHALLARRDFLLADVEALEQYVQAQRERLREVAGQLIEVTERVPGGLADLRRPLLSASADQVVAFDPPTPSSDPVLDPTMPMSAPVATSLFEAVQASDADITEEHVSPTDDPFHIAGEELQ